MDPSVAMAKLLAAALENRLNASVPDGEYGTQHTSCAEAPCFIANDYCVQAARVHVGSRTASPHVVPPLAFTETERLFSATHKPKPLISTHSKQFNAKT